MSPRLSFRVSLLVISVVFAAGIYPASAQPNLQGQWSTEPNLMPINPIHVVLLPNGKLLIVAGSGNCPPTQSGCPSGPPYNQANGSGALLWDPATETYTQWFSVSWDMFCNALVLLPDGRALVNGGNLQYDPFHGAAKNSIFDPATNTFTDIANMAHGRWYPTLLTLGDGRLMTFSGINESGSTNHAVEYYDPASGWSTEYTSSWIPDLYPRLHLLPTGKVLYSGAQTGSRLFDPSTQTWGSTFAITNYGNTRTYGSSVLLPLTLGNNYGAKILILGGHNPATSTTEILDMRASPPRWVYGPNMSQGRIEMNAVLLPDGKVLAVGGSVNDEDSTTSSYNADLYDPVTNTFSSAGKNAYPRLYHSVAVLLPDATVWLAGGNPSRGSYTKQIEIYKPPYLFNADGSAATRPTITGAPSSVGYGNAFTVNTPDAANISSVVLVRNPAVTHAFNMDEREVQLSYTAGSGSLTVTAPPHGNIAPPGYYMLFILNSAHVPSVARFVQITNATQTAPADFTLSVTPSSQAVVPGAGTTFSVSISPLNGFSGTASLSASGLPTGATGSFNPSSIQASGSSTLSISTSSSIAAGSYPLTVTATSGTLTHSAPVTLNVGSFSVAVSPTSQTVKRGTSASYTITVSATTGFSSPVSFSLAGLPKRTSGSFAPTTVTGSGTSKLTILPNKNAAAGTYTLTITSSGGGLTRSNQVTLTIQ
jgi:Domain of unknown function (DUF1929)/Glyoxal oxidase N-terminus